MLSYLLILGHLIGDYVLQSHAMAVRKTSSWRWAWIHAACYSIPFAVLLGCLHVPIGSLLLALLIIGGTHAIIDRYRLAAVWCRWYGVGFPGLWWRGNGWQDPPPFLGVWLIILVDNTMHLAINGAVVWGLGT